MRLTLDEGIVSNVHDLDVCSSIPLENAHLTPLVPLGLHRPTRAHRPEGAQGQGGELTWFYDSVRLRAAALGWPVKQD
jgi:hypothetical protein